MKLLLPAAALAALLILAVWLRSGEPPPPKPVGVAAPPPQQPIPVPAPLPPPQAEPLLDRWREAVLRKDAAGVLRIQQEFLAREGEHRERLEAMAKDDPAPRVRAFCVTVLSRFRSRPAEGWFVERLGDVHESPREAAILALEQLGTKSGAEALGRVAASDPVERLRPIAERAARRAGER
jgi:hypothetical protein